MGRVRWVPWLAGVFAALAAPAAGFDLAAYQQFLRSHADLSGADLEAMYPAGRFERYAATDFAAAAYSDSVDHQLRLTDQEKELLARHGFVVTERLSPASFGAAFLDTYNRDLPVFVSADAVLHALHMSYDAILVELEYSLLEPWLEEALERLHRQLAAATPDSAQSASMGAVRQDVDLYLTVPRRLLGQAVTPVYPANASRVDDLLARVAAPAPAGVELFGSFRTVDFSQFIPRGHYTQSAALTRYFQAMVWLGRTELYLRAPAGAIPPVPDEAVRHQAAMAGLLAELATDSGADEALGQIDAVLKALVGEQDNATLALVRQGLAGRAAAELLEPGGLARFQAAIAAAGGGSQRILSQILCTDPMAPQQLEPAGACLLLGQRFVLDSFLTGNVVYDKITFRGERVFRGLPSTLDVLFALGNDAVLPLLEPELAQYRYATNLAGLRYLVDSFDAPFWTATYYNGWLGAIRALNPPASRDGLPAFMRTGAWWQEKLNTQLASWAQLRHDHLLYAKQSYTGGTTCSFPEGYVEPLPGFYQAVRGLADRAAAQFQQLAPGTYGGADRVSAYFAEVGAVADTLAQIAAKQLARSELDPAERRFLQTVLYSIPGDCGTSYGGWYPRLFITGEDGFLSPDLVVADVHTQPTDADGAAVGYVLHVGTGPVNTAVVVADRPDGVSTAFVGPVMSYYEHVSANFDRLTDEEWQLAWSRDPSFRPDFVRLYLADAAGQRQAPGRQLPTAVAEAAAGQPQGPALTLGRGFPNPFNASVLIGFAVGPELAGQQIRLTVHNTAGQVVTRLVDQVLAAGSYTARWDGADRRGRAVASGVYTCLLAGGSQRSIAKVVLLR
jgi:hypothetical protein